jgi:hypothetical protein
MAGDSIRVAARAAGAAGRPFGTIAEG